MYDVIIIGGGLGYTAAIVLGKAGKKVALIEKDLSHIGGTCLHNGCIPSKNLLHRAKTVIESQEDVFTKKASVNLKNIKEKIEAILQKSTSAVINQCKAAGVDLIEGKAEITDEGVKVGNKIFNQAYTIIATGSKPRIPSEIEIDYKKIITSDEALKMEHIPKEISIYGTGAIGLEMATVFAAFGSKVNLIYRHENISRKFPQAITQNLEKQLKNIGVNLIPNTSIQKAYVKNNKAVIHTQDKTFETEYLLVATGRVPDTDAVKTDKIAIEKGAVKTDEYFRTTMPGVFAIGDCNGKLLLAHAARAEALNVADQILGNKEKLNLKNIPKFIYTLPLSYANIGKATENSASFPLSYLGISGSGFGDKNGMVILYSDDENFITGADILAPNAEELIGIIATALTAELDINTFKKTVFPHPTYSEAIDRTLRRFR